MQQSNSFIFMYLFYIFSIMHCTCATEIVMGALTCILFAGHVKTWKADQLLIHVKVFYLTHTQLHVSSSIIWNWPLQKWGFPLGVEPGTSHTPNLWSPIARHTCNTARPAFPYPYRPTGDDVVGLTTIFFMLYSEL